MDIPMDIPKEWTFESIETASEFDTHVKSQLPWYDLATSAIAHIARHYIPEEGLIYDIGSSTGNIGRALEGCIKSRQATLVAIDKSAAMAAQYNAPGSLIHADALTFDYQPYDVAILFLSLMFFPPAKRLGFVKSLVGQIKPGGCLIILDKISIPRAYISTVLHRLTIAGKVANGCDLAQITTKELSLSGVQRPLPHNFAQRLDWSATEFFRFGEFVGWIIDRCD